MKVRITTYHNVINRGALLQAYGLKLNFQKLFPEADVKMVEYTPFSITLYEFLRALRPKAGAPLSNFHRYRMIRNDSKKLFGRLDHRSVERILSSMDKNDLVFVGSDCIWRLVNKPPSPKFPNDYWLPYPSQAKKISYSTSANGTDESLIAESQPHIKKLLSDFDLIAVRDSFTKSMIDFSDANITPDPSFFVPLYSQYSQHPLVDNHFNNHPQSVALQIYHPDFRSHIQEYIDFNSAKGVFGFTNNFSTTIQADGLLNTLQWAHIFQKCSFVITDSFHGTIFSLRSKTPFISLETKGFHKGHSKKYQLLSYLGLEDLYLDIDSGDNASNNKAIVDRQEKIMENWESTYLPLVEKSLSIIFQDLETYNNKIQDLF